MFKLKVTVFILSFLLILQTVMFIMFGLYYNDKNFRKFVDKNIIPTFSSDKTKETNKITINEIYSYRIYGNNDDDNLASITLFDNTIFFLANKTKNGKSDIWLFSIDKDGITSKEVSLGQKDLDETATSFYIDQDNIYITGELYKNNTPSIWIVKLTNFTYDWDIIIESKEKSVSPVITKLSNSTIVIAFSTKAINTNALSIAITHITPQEDITNIIVFPGEIKDNPISIVEFSNGDYWIVGESKSFGFGETDIFIIAFNKQNNIKWFKIFGTSFSESPSAILKEDDGIIISTTAKHFSLIKVNTNGEIEWTKKYTTGGISSLYKFGKNIFGTGTIYDPYSPNNILIFETDERFNILWEEFYSFNYDETPYGIFVDSNFIYIGGTSYNDKTLRDLWLVKLKRGTTQIISNTNTLTDASIEILSKDIPLETITNIPISSTNKSPFRIYSIKKLPQTIAKRFEEEAKAIKLEEKRSKQKKHLNKKK